MRKRATMVTLALLATSLPLLAATPAQAVAPTCTAMVDGVRLASNNDVTYNGFWCLNGNPVNDGDDGEGLVFNLRAALAMVDAGTPDFREEQYDYGSPNDTNDDWDDPDVVGNDDGDERNLAEFTGALDDLADKGLDMVTVSLMDAFAGYTCNDTDPMKGRPGWTAWEDDRGNTELMAAAEADLDAIIEVADTEGIIVNIQMFYQASSVYPLSGIGDRDNATLIDRVQEAMDYIANFVDNEHTDGHRNITIDVANEISKGTNYPAYYLDGPTPSDGNDDIVQALGYLQGALALEGIGRQNGSNNPLVPVSVSKSGGGIFGTAPFRQQVDWYSVHENSEVNSTFASRDDTWINMAKGTTAIWDRPIVVTEEDIDHEVGAQEASALAFTQTTSGSFDLGVAENISPNVTLFGCETPGHNNDDEPEYTDNDALEYKEGFQSFPVNWSPTSSTLKTTVFNRMSELASGSPTTPPDDIITAVQVDTWTDEVEDDVIDQFSFSGENVDLLAGQSYIVAVNSGDTKTKNGGVDLAADPDPVRAVTLQSGGSAGATATEIGGANGIVWYGAGANTTERQRFQVFRFDPTSNLNGFVRVDYGSRGTIGAVTVAVVEVAAGGGTDVTLASSGTYNGAQAFTTPDFTTTEIDHADGADKDGHLSVFVVRDQTVTVTPETADGWATVSQLDTTANSQAPHVTLDVSVAATYDTDNENSYLLSANKRYAGAMFEIDAL